ncbi:MAG: RiPP maturation radical SAM protein 1 [bacterium]|nr:RiPP maturation radical SAM protein 1 [bacterium]
MDVCLVNLPYFTVCRPTLGLSLLNTILNNAAIKSSILYANIRFAEEIGLDRYNLCAYDGRHFFVGDWTFANAVFEEEFCDNSYYLDRIIDVLSPSMKNLKEQENIKEYIDDIRVAAKSFINKLAEEIVSISPKIVGSSSLTFQHNASLALFKRLKELDPGIVTMMGGGLCETTMGYTTHKCFPFVDYVVSGEGDSIIVDLVEKIFRYKREVPVDELPQAVLGPLSREQHYKGLSFFNDTNSENNEDGMSRELVHDLDHLPTPDFDDYFDTLYNSGIKAFVKPGLMIETSRGCWWGTIQKCKFCGLNGRGITFRKKSTPRLLSEIEELEEKHGISKFGATDTVLALDYFKDLFPTLAKSETRRTFFFEVKSNLKKEQLKLMQDSGALWAQPGVESLLTEVLDIMRKGVKAFQNIRLLKWTREFGLRMHWNFLWGFPGEDDEWYASLKDLLPLLEHLQPPNYLLKIQVHRFSYYFDNAREVNFNLKPIPVMSYVYNVPEEDLFGLSYSFLPDDWDNIFDNPSLLDYKERPGIQQTRELINRWHDVFWSEQSAELTMTDDEQSLTIRDTRACAVQENYSLTGLHRMVYITCDDTPLEEKLQQAVFEKFGVDSRQDELSAVVDDLYRDKLIIKQDSRLMSLALKANLPPLPRDVEYPGGAVDISSWKKI